MSVGCCLSAAWKALTEGNWVFSAGLIPVWQRALWHSGKWSVPGKGTGGEAAAPSTPGTDTAAVQGACPLCKYSPQGQEMFLVCLGFAWKSVSWMLFPYLTMHLFWCFPEWVIIHRDPETSELFLDSLWPCVWICSLAQHWQHGKHQQGSAWSLGDEVFPYVRAVRLGF